MKYFSINIFVILALSSCVSLKSPQERFIINMNTTASYNETIDEQYSHSRFIAEKYLVDIEINNGIKTYHFRKPSIIGGYCYYHFLVNENSKKVIGWGFDNDLGSPDKCGNSG